MNFHWHEFDWRRKLSAEEAAELAARVAELTKAGLPLGPGLRALAAELPGWRLPRMLRVLAYRLDTGADLVGAMESQGRGLPPQLRGLVLAGLRSGRLADVLEEYVDLQRSQLELRRRVWMSLAYPFILLLCMMLLAVGSANVVASFEKIFRDFGTRLPAMTEFLIKTSRPTACFFEGLFCLLIVFPLLLRLAPRVRWVWPILNRVPMIGPLLRWSHLSQFSRLMGLLLTQNVPLPDALRLTAVGLRDKNLARGCLGVADDAEKGRILYESMAARRPFPASLIPIVEWGQRTPALPDAFYAAAEMFEGRVRSQGAFLEAILLPVMFLAIIIFAGFFIIAMFMPLICLIQKLT